MTHPTDPKSSVRDILAKLDRSIDRARAKRIEDETGHTLDHHAPKQQQATPLRARPLRGSEAPNEPDPGGKWIGRQND